MPKNLKKNKKSRNRTSVRSRKNKSSFLKRVITYLWFGSFFIISMVLLVYFFVLPSVLLGLIKTKNILIVSDNLDQQNSHILLAHLSSNSDKNLLIFIDGKQVIDAGENYGEYSLNTVYQLYKIDNKTDQEIKSMFSKIFNITISDIVVTNEIFESSLEIKKLKKVFVNNLIKDFDRSINNKINLLSLLFSVDAMDTFEFSKITDIKKIYYKLSTIEEQTYQNCSVSVVNTTEESGLAQRMSEIIENTGAQVMQTVSNDSMIDKTTIYFPIDKVECQQLTDKISGIFPFKVVLQSSDQLSSEQQFRANMVIMIGKDY